MGVNISADFRVVHGVARIGLLWRGAGAVERGSLENHLRSFILILSNTSLALWVREICYVSCTVVQSVLIRSGTFGSIRWQTRWQNPKGAKPLRNFAEGAGATIARFFLATATRP
jgi:hypothetical protein